MGKAHHRESSRLQQALHEAVAGLEFGKGQEFIGLMGLRDVARPADGGGIAGLLKLPGLGAVTHDAHGIVAGQAAASASASPSASGVKGGDAEEAVQMDPRLGADGFHCGLEARGFGDEGLRMGLHLHRDDAHFEREAAIGGGDVMGGAALNHADMQRGEGRIEGQRRRGRGVAPGSGVAVVDPPISRAPSMMAETP
jgi:hypothetical protein